MKLHSIASIARLLDVPESTLHYWKNRFASVLPCVGQGRHKRFGPEAVDMFRVVARQLEAGLGVDEIKAGLARNASRGGMSPAAAMPAVSAVSAVSATSVTFAEGGSPAPQASAAFMPQAGGGDPAPPRPVAVDPEELALRIGTSIAEALGERLRDYLGPAVHAAAPALPMENLDALKAELEQTRRRMDTQREENQEMARKLTVLEAELVRLRKDGREMEKFLLEKIRGAGA